MKHTCHAPGCSRPVPPRLFMCHRHWYMLPCNLRARIWATYRPGQEVTKDPSRAYLEAAREAQDYIRAAETDCVCCNCGQPIPPGAYREFYNGRDGELVCGPCVKQACAELLALYRDLLETVRADLREADDQEATS